MPRFRFNPRAREGRDVAPSISYVRSPSFNPRAREGRDAILSQASTVFGSFNPRAREGRDERLLIGLFQGV